eukprot:2568458-Pyramimonas_sp.AAC.1
MTAAVRYRRRPCWRAPKDDLKEAPGDPGMARKLLPDAWGARASRPLPKQARTCPKRRPDSETC